MHGEPPNARVVCAETRRASESDSANEPANDVSPLADSVRPHALATPSQNAASSASSALDDTQPFSYPKP